MSNIRHVWQRLAQSQLCAARNMRWASSKVDELDLDFDEEVKEAQANETEQEKAPEMEMQSEEEEARPRSMYTFGCILNGRTGTNVGTMDLLSPFTAQKPQKMEFFDNFAVKKVSGYYKHYLTLTEDGRVFAWGSNNYGQLGCGDESSYPKDRHAPVLVRTEDGEPLQNIVDVSAGKYHSAAVDAEGRVYTWGYGGRRGRFLKSGHLLGHPAKQGMFHKFNSFAIPLAEFGPENGMEVESQDNQFGEGKRLNAKAMKVSCGALHTIVLDSLGRAWTWGYGEWGRLGQDDNEDRNKPTPVVSFLDEKTGLPRIAFGDVQACESVSGFVTTEGTVYICGSDYTRQLGFGMEEQGLRTARFEAVSTPRHVDQLSNITNLSFGSHSALAVNRAGVPYYWGSQEARGPQAFTDFGQRSKQKVKKIACGTGPLVDHRAFITTDGVLYTTGANLHGQTLADTRPRDPDASAMSVLSRYLGSWRPTRLSTIAVNVQHPKFFADKKVVDVICGHSSTVVMCEDLTADELSKRYAIEESTAHHREEILKEAIEEYEEVESRRRGKGKKTKFGA